MNKAPKRPKASASSKQWESYDKKKTEHNKANKSKMAIMKKYAK